ncbi:HipA domain-containing protein [Pseudomonas sp. NPDC007930]|uniref:HipA domain-containing protein n=1 Tax=Pseudomonas sp. NPDC007930 TaxID=3364417 RepID=UPI0036EC84EC
MFIDRDAVGELREHQGLWQFSYAAQWQARENAFDLAPSLPRSAGLIADGASERPVQWFFDNLLPEEAARTLLAQDAQVEHADAFGLLASYGAESAGALTLRLPGSEPEAGGLQPLPAEALSERIRRLPRASLAAQAPKRMSLAGAQHKLAVVVRGGELFEPIGSFPSTHILKPDHPDPELYPHSVANEGFVMELARRCGLPVPAVQWRRVPEPIYLIERFDRATAQDLPKRLYVLDACQLLGIEAIWKYQQATLGTLARLLAMCRSRAATRLALFRWLVFNLIVGNNDSHLKNLSFFVRPEGVELAPHYDLLCTSVYAPGNGWLETELVWKTATMRRHHDVRRAPVLEMAIALGVPPTAAAREIDRQCLLVPRAAAELYTAQAPTLLAGEARLLRQVVHGVIRDMATRLAA